jgi:hypothetical protein
MTYFLVSSDPRLAPDDYLSEGFESPHDMARAVRRLCSEYGGRVGECVASRHGFRLLRFRDTPDGYPVEEWLPGYLLSESPPPPYYLPKPPSDPLLEELDQAMGFD